MKRSFFRRTLPVAAILWASLGGTSQAYVRARSHDGKHDVIWPDPHIQMTVHTGGVQVLSPEDFVGAVTAAAGPWNAPRNQSSVEIVITSSSDALAHAAPDHENTITFRTDSWDAPLYPHGALALTELWDSGGRIVEADIEINAVDPRFHWGLLSDDPALAALSTEIDLQNALTHELGHVVGLSHPCYLEMPADAQVDNFGQPVLGCDDPALPSDVLAATMYPRAKAGDIAERTLSPDELMALGDLYPVGRPPTMTGPTSAGGCSVAGERRGSETVTLTTMAAGLLLLMRRRPRHGRWRDAKTQTSRPSELRRLVRP